MSGDEVKEWTENKEAQNFVHEWLEDNGVEITWTSKASTISRPRRASLPGRHC